MIHLDPPPGFVPDFYGVGCFVKSEGDILLLLRQDDLDIEPGKWGVPGGRVNRLESARKAMVRELEEETGLIVNDPKSLVLHDVIYVVYPKHNFIYHIFSLPLEIKPEISLAPCEHKDFIWRSPCEALKMDLMLDEDHCIRMVFGV